MRRSIKFIVINIQKAALQMHACFVSVSIQIYVEKCILIEIEFY